MGEIEVLLHHAAQQSGDSSVSSAIKECLQKIQQQTPSASGAKPGSSVQPPMRTGTVWDEFDVTKLRNAGAKLQFRQPDMKKGQKIGRIELSDVEPEIQYWQSAVICYILGANPPFPVAIFGGFGAGLGLTRF